MVPAHPTPHPPPEDVPSPLSFSLPGVQILANVFLYLCAITVGIMSYYMADRKHRKAFLEARQSLEVKMNLEEQSQQQVRLQASGGSLGAPGAQFGPWRGSWGLLGGREPSAVWRPPGSVGLELLCQVQGLLPDVDPWAPCHWRDSPGLELLWLETPSYISLCLT